MTQTGAPGGAQPTIMVVDDNHDVRALLRVWLGRLDYRVVEAADGPAAVRVATRERPDLILMDLHLPKMDGFSAAYHIRQQANLGSHVPIIAVSADNELGREARRPTSEDYDVDFTDFVPKPFSPAQLKDVLDHYLPRGGGVLKE